MSQREDRPSSWRADAESTSASGGHVAREDDTPRTSLFDSLDAPLPSELERSSERRTPEGPTRQMPAPQQPDDRGATPRPREGTRRRRRVTPRRVKRKIKHVDPLSVLKVSLLMYAVFLVFWLVAVALLYNFLVSLGLFEAIEDFGRGLVLWEEVNITLGLVEKWAFIIGLLFVIVGSLLNVVLAFLYNLISDLVGGIEVIFVERDQ